MQKIETPEEYSVFRFDGVSMSGVFTGCLLDAERVTEKLDWREDDAGTGMPTELLTLAEIRQQISGEQLVTVVELGPLSGTVLQCGNYGHDDWWVVGELAGYA